MCQSAGFLENKRKPKPNEVFALPVDPLAPHRGTGVSGLLPTFPSRFYHCGSIEKSKQNDTKGLTQCVDSTLITFKLPHTVSFCTP